MLPTIEWKDGKVVMIDQRLLPHKEVYITCTEHEQVAVAIEQMAIRGAPAIGVAAAFGLALGISKLKSGYKIEDKFEALCRRLEKTRPTARNLFWSLERMKAAFEANRLVPLENLKDVLIEEALAIEAEDIETCRRIGAWGKSLVRDGASILTHCNAGELATAGYGTALGVIRAAFEDGKKVHVWAGETRPLLQGARLTAWELHKLGIPFTLITDSMAGHLMRQGEISQVITGADRIAGNGDTANKIGTYGLAVLAKENGLPFYIAAPFSTVDLSLASGQEIPIEERSAEEVRRAGAYLLTLEGTPVRNPAFDVTPSKYITSIITENGIALPPYDKSLADLARLKKA
ncbi:MAG: S-methyl-5-thioribose-1-phosphate isomerase [Candidatus Aminicenantes bacterium]|nr:S-methyl-5-thioribose-1-phosphate isomerase [Candidatus Aminicenantes bacterium]